MSPKKANEEKIRIDELRTTVEAKVASYDPSKKGDESKYQEGEAVDLTTLVKYFSTKKDLCILTVGTICAFCQGGSWPGMMVFFGDFTNTLGATVADFTKQFDVMDILVLRMVYFSLGVFVFSFWMSYAYQVYSENLGLNMRIKYFESCLRQDAAFFDK